ncbi:unnamed protein product [Trichogramma brassicae]|uniref:Uncharacterized protein n=1 Tax=Trichogramma brassicae TaxID=86971 RepID=A0A6H5IBY3_9HYME|nr:unnamed protein product [Trichogramma brassicae]
MGNTRIAYDVIWIGWKRCVESRRHTRRVSACERVRIDVYILHVSACGTLESSMLYLKSHQSDRAREIVPIVCATTSYTSHASSCSRTAAAAATITRAFFICDTTELLLAFAPSCSAKTIATARRSDQALLRAQIAIAARFECACSRVASIVRYKCVTAHVRRSSHCPIVTLSWVEKQKKKHRYT